MQHPAAPDHDVAYPVRGSHTVRYECAPARLFHILVEGLRNPAYRPADRKYTLVSGDGASEGTVIHVEIGGGTTVFRVAHLAPDRELALEFVDGPFRGPYTYRIAPYGDACLLTVDFRFHIHEPRFQTLSRIHNLSLLNSLPAFSFLQFIDELLQEAP